MKCTVFMFLFVVFVNNNIIETDCSSVLKESVSQPLASFRPSKIDYNIYGYPVGGSPYRMENDDYINRHPLPDTVSKKIFVEYANRNFPSDSRANVKLKGPLSGDTSVQLATKGHGSSVYNNGPGDFKPGELTITSPLSTYGLGIQSDPSMSPASSGAGDVPIARNPARPDGTGYQSVVTPHHSHTPTTKLSLTLTQLLPLLKLLNRHTSRSTDSQPAQTSTVQRLSKALVDRQEDPFPSNELPGTDSAGRNTEEHVPPDPYLALLLSHYGKYLTIGDVRSGGSRQYGIYSYAAANSIHNNMPHGSYKIYEDND